MARGGGSLLLLVDDAAALPGETAAQLASWLIASGGALQIVLAGLPGAALRHARDAFGDRAEDLLLVSGLRPEEIRGYVHSRLAAVGAGDALRAAFDDAAIAELARVSEGNPRRMNLAAQAIARSLRVASEAKAPSAPAAGVEAARATARSAADDLGSVGEYRFVRGRFVDPGSGEARADGPEVVPHVEKPMAPLPPRRRTVPRPAYTPPLEIDRTPGKTAEPKIEIDEEKVDEEIRPPVVAPAPLRVRASRSPTWWIAAGIGLFGFAVGAWWQLGGDDEQLPTARVTLEPMEIGKIGPPDQAPAPAAAAPELPAPPIAAVPPAGNAPEAPATAPVPESPEPTGDVAAVVSPSPPSASETPAQSPGVPVPDAPAAPAPTPIQAPTPAAPPTPSAETVRVAINATPWAVIEVDGAEIGETPLAGVRLAVGRHRFRARMPDGSVREQVIRIDTENTTVVFE
jgi:hypothetical protein